MYKSKIKLIKLILITTTLFLYFSCGPLPLSRVWGSNDTAPQPAEIPKSLTGEVLESRSVSNSVVSRAIDNWDSIFAGISAEYGDFFQVALVAFNYSAPFEQEKPTWYRLINSPYTNWKYLPGGGSFTKEVLSDGGMFRTNDNFTEWEWITIGSGADTIRRHLRVSRQNGYTHTTLFMWHIGGMDSNDTIDIVETDKYKIIRCVEAADLSGDGDVYTVLPPTPAGTTNFIEFFGITNKDSVEHTLGIRGDESATINGSLDYVMDGNYVEKIGAFDNFQLLIRPDNYPAPLTDLDAVMGLNSQLETFDSSNFPTLIQVQGVRDNVGFTPQEVAQGVINSDYTYKLPSPCLGTR
jgi:hypothetical protein